MVRYLVDHGVAVNGPVDVHGNSLLHMAISSDRLSMYDYLVDECGASRDALNLEGDTPLQMAVRLNNRVLVHHIIFKHRQILWQYGGRVSYTLEMRGVDGISRTSNEVSERISSLEVIVQNSYIELLNAMPVIELMYAKWSRSARGHFVATALTYVVGLVGFTLLCQHSRGSVFGDCPAVLKVPLNTLEFCSPESFSEDTVLADGTVITAYGRGLFNCDQSGNAWSGPQFALEPIFLHILVLIHALIFTSIEFLDMSMFVRERFSDAKFRAQSHRNAPPPPPLHAIPSQVIDDERIQVAARLALTGRGKARTTADGHAAGVPASLALWNADKSYFSSHGMSLTRQFIPCSTSRLGTSSLTDSAGTSSIADRAGVSSLSKPHSETAGASSKEKGVSHRRPATQLKSRSSVRFWVLPPWLEDHVLFAREVFRAIFWVYIPRNPTSVLLW